MLVTRLFGTTMPLIRYKMTDSPTIEWRHDASEAPAYRRITQLHGRSDVWFYYSISGVHNQNEKVKIHPIRPIHGDSRISSTTDCKWS